MSRLDDLLQIDLDIIKKLTVLSILQKDGEQEALRLYPELSHFIYACRDLSLEEAKELLLKQGSEEWAH